MDIIKNMVTLEEVKPLQVGNEAINKTVMKEITSGIKK